MEGILVHLVCRTVIGGCVTGSLAACQGVCVGTAAVEVTLVSRMQLPCLCCIKSCACPKRLMGCTDIDQPKGLLIKAATWQPPTSLTLRPLKGWGIFPMQIAS